MAPKSSHIHEKKTARRAQSVGLSRSNHTKLFQGKGEGLGTSAIARTQKSIFMMYEPEEDVVSPLCPPSVTTSFMIRLISCSN